MTVSQLSGELNVGNTCFRPVAETGVCVEVRSEYQIALSDSGIDAKAVATNETWTMTAESIVKALDVKVGDRVSAVLLSKDGRPNGPMFLAFNHRSQMSQYFEEAIDDLYYFLPKSKGWLSGIRVNRQLKKLASSMPVSSFYKNVRGGLAALP